LPRVERIRVREDGKRRMGGVEVHVTARPS
jgi:hypothetical protein